MTSFEYQPQQPTLKWERLSIPGTTKRSSKDATKLYKAVQKEAGEIDQERLKLYKERQRLQSIPPSDLTEQDLASVGEVRDNHIKLLIRERRFRSETLERYLDILADDNRRAGNVVREELIAEIERLKAGLSDLGYDMRQPRQAAYVNQHLNVIRLRMEVSIGSDSNQAHRRENRDSMERIDETISRMRQKAMMI